MERQTNETYEDFDEKRRIFLVDGDDDGLSLDERVDLYLRKKNFNDDIACRLAFIETVNLGEGILEEDKETIVFASSESREKYLEIRNYFKENLVFERIEETHPKF